MGYSLVTYASADRQVFGSEAEVIRAVAQEWPGASVSIMTDEVGKQDCVVIWRDEVSRGRFDHPVGWVERDPESASFDRGAWSGRQA